MSEHISMERTQDLIDGLLPSETAERARSHLAECAECRERHARLAEVVSDLAALPREAAAPAGSWEAIALRIAGTLPDAGPPTAEVLPLPGVSHRAARITFTLPQLVAASTVLAVVSAGTIWLAMSGPATPAPETGGGAAGRFATDDGAYDAALEELLGVVETARPFLAPQTLLALDESLAVIDAAIDEILDALANDPASDLLRGMLANQQRSRLRVLRQVAALAPASS
jgi:hypothetical protein